MRTAKSLDGEVPAGLILESVNAGSVNEQANLTTISAKTNDPELSAKIANAYSAAYIEFRAEAAQKGLTEQITKAENEIENLSDAESEGIRGEKLREKLDALMHALRDGEVATTEPGADHVLGDDTMPIVR